ncbi:DUF2271 domain-containing protein [candidate division KSB1 bacterium]|nr:DUF2271 domain-containing protein [candidate division KSB1 bacterium]
MRNLSGNKWTTLYWSILLFFPIFLLAQNTTESVQFKVTTSSPGGQYSPRNIGAIWIEDASGNFVRTLEVWANRRKQYLYTWNKETSGNTVDAITSATSSSHTTHQVTWDIKNASGNRVADGDYTLKVEMTDQHAQGPIASFAFPVGQASGSLSLTDKTYFHNLELSWNSVVSSVGNESMTHPSLELYQNYPNPFNPTTKITYSLAQDSFINLTVFKADGAKIKTLVNTHQNSGRYTVLFDATVLPSGMYFYKITADKFSIVRKMSLVK